MERILNDVEFQEKVLEFIKSGRWITDLMFTSVTRDPTHFQILRNNEPREENFVREEDIKGICNSSFGELTIYTKKFRILAYGKYIKGRFSFDFSFDNEDMDVFFGDFNPSGLVEFPLKKIGLLTKSVR